MDVGQPNQLNATVSFVKKTTEQLNELFTISMISISNKAKYCKLDSIEYSKQAYEIRVMGETSNIDSMVPFVYPIHTRLKISCKPSSGYELVHINYEGDRKTSVRVQDDQMVVTCKTISPGVLGSWSEPLPICTLGKAKLRAFSSTILLANRVDLIHFFYRGDLLSIHLFAAKWRTIEYK